ncbi:MAG: hypothetical protein ACRD9R_22845 [Pyrinomonadaceae bacterium]
MTRHISIEGYSPSEILEFPDKQIDAFVFCEGPLVFRAGTAIILGEFRVTEHKLIVELAQIDGGGEGILPALWALAERIAARKDLAQVEWIVHAVNCAKPNLKLRRLLIRKGFVIANVPHVGEAYCLLHPVSKSSLKDNETHGRD